MATEISKQFKAIDTSGVESKLEKLINAKASQTAQAMDGKRVRFDLVMDPEISWDESRMRQKLKNLIDDIQGRIDQRAKHIKIDFDISTLAKARKTRDSAEIVSQKDVDNLMQSVMDKFNDYIGGISKLKPSQTSKDYNNINKLKVDIASILKAIQEKGNTDAENDYKDVISYIKQIIGYNKIVSNSGSKFKNQVDSIVESQLQPNADVYAKAYTAVTKYEIAERKAKKAEREAAEEAKKRAEIEAKLREEYEAKFKAQEEATKKAQAEAEAAKQAEQALRAETEALKEQQKVVEVSNKKSPGSAKALAKEWSNLDVSNRADALITRGVNGKIDADATRNALRDFEQQISQKMGAKTEADVKELVQMVNAYKQAVAEFKAAHLDFTEKKFGITQKSIADAIVYIRKQNAEKAKSAEASHEEAKAEQVVTEQAKQQSVQIAEQAKASEAATNATNKRAEAEQKVADATKQEAEALQLVNDLNQKIRKLHADAGQPIPTNNNTGFGGGGGQLPPEAQALLSRFNSTARNLWGYYSGSHDVTTGKFGLKQYKSYIHSNRKINEFLNSVDTDDSIQKLIGQYPELQQAYDRLITAKEECAKDMQIIVAQGKAVGDISKILTDDSIGMVERLDQMANLAFQNGGAYHAKYSQGDNEKRVAASMRYLVGNANAHFTENALKKEGLLSSEAYGSLKIANAQWGEHFALVNSYFKNVETVSDDLRKQFKDVQSVIAKARDEIAPTKVDAKRRGIANERDVEALKNIDWLSKHADQYYTMSGLKDANLLKDVPAKTFIGLESEWYKYVNAMSNYFKTSDNIQAEVQKKFEALITDIDRIESEVVDERVKLERNSRSKSDSLSGKSAKDKAVRAYEYFNDYQNEYKYRQLKLFDENNLLSSQQKAQLEDVRKRREEEDALIQAYDAENKLLSEQYTERTKIVAKAEELAKAELLRVQGKTTAQADNLYATQIQQILDAQYRMINFQQKRDTVGLTGLELNELDKATESYQKLYQVLFGVEKKQTDLQNALATVNAKEAEVSGKLSRKWSDIRDRRYGSYLNEDDAAKYRGHADIERGLQRYVERSGAKSFQLFDGKAVGNIQKYRAEVENTDGTIEKLNLTLNKTTGELYSVSMGTKQSTSFFEQFSEGLKRRAISLAQYAMTFASLRTAIQTFRAAINNVKDLDSAFVELSRISHDSSAALEEFRKKSFEVADQVGSTAAQVINSAAQWEHLGYNVKEAGELAKVSSIYKNIADGMSSDSEATEDLVAIMKAYGFQANQAIDVTDALIAVSNNYAVTAADIGNALKRSASAMSVANNTFEQNVALATAMAEVTQNAEKSGSALQVLSLRIRGAKTELQEMGEDTDDMASSTSKLRAQVKGLTKGFDIMKDDKTFKQTYDIMKGIAAVWDDLDDIQRAKCCLCVQRCA